MMLIKAVILILIPCAINCFDERHAKKWLQYYNDNACEKSREINAASWTYQTDISAATEMDLLNSELGQKEWDREVTRNASRYNWQNFKDYDVRRQLKFLSVKGSTVLSDEEVKDFLELKQKMQSKYSTAKTCSYGDPSNCDQKLEPDLTRVMAKSRDYDELKWAWEKWRESSGKRMRHEFIKYMAYENQIANHNGFRDGSEYWVRKYETEDFEDQIETLWKELQPFYLQLHAYVRNILRQVYGIDKVSRDGPIPAHLLGNMWAQSWVNLEYLLLPYPEVNLLDVTAEMRNQDYDPVKMVRMAEEFFTSLGIQKMPKEFWEKSIFERIEGKEMVCHASAWDFCEKNNVRIKMCAEVDMDTLITMHHEMGHVVYFLEYSDQPYTYKDGANPGFHEAIGDVVALSVSTPKHLHKVGLLKDFKKSHEDDLNFLMKMALDKIAFLPFGYLVDAYRWKILKGEIAENELNCKWWELREKYQGIKAPVPRNESDFDPGAKYHVAGDVPYIRYFVATILQFDFHRSLCKEAGEYDPDDSNKPLYLCDIYQSKKAGRLFSSILKMGSSRPWPDVMEKITGRKNMSASAIRQYFKPLEQWLMEENKKTGEKIGWEEDGGYCSSEGYTPTTRDCSSAVTVTTSAVFLVFILAFL